MKRYYYELVVCEVCKGSKYIRTEDCRCNECTITEPCKNCNAKGVVKVIKETNKNK